MPATVTLASDDDVLIFTADEPWGGGPTFDEVEDWDELPEVPIDATKRPEAIGDYLPAQTYPRGARPGIEGQWYASSVVQARRNRERLMAFYNDGRPITMIVADELRTTSREVLVASIDAPWTHLPYFDFTIDTMAEDARRYGPRSILTTGLPRPGSGLRLPSDGATGTGLDFGTTGLDLGTLGDDGRIVVRNDGNAETPLELTVAGGSMPDGFEVVEVETGRRIPYVGPVVSGTSVTLDTHTEAAYINGTTPASRFLASPEWYQLPRRSTRTYAFVARGAVMGTPTLTVASAPAYY